MRTPPAKVTLPDVAESKSDAVGDAVESGESRDRDWPFRSSVWPINTAESPRWAALRWACAIFRPIMVRRAAVSDDARPLPRPPPRSEEPMPDSLSPPRAEEEEEDETPPFEWGSMATGV